jgi:hypothetical protein
MADEVQRNDDGLIYFVPSKFVCLYANNITAMSSSCSYDEIQARVSWRGPFVELEAQSGVDGEGVARLLDLKEPLHFGRANGWLGYDRNGGGKAAVVPGRAPA